MKAHEIVSEVLKEMASMALPGVATKDIDAMAEKKILELGGVPYNKGYHMESAKTPYPYATCISVENVIAHGYPSELVLREGDVVNLDTSVRDSDGNCGDAALSVGVGEISDRKKRLLRYSKDVLYKTIEYMTPGRSTKELAHIIEFHALNMGFLVNRRFCGHRIGTDMHMGPKIYNSEEEGHIWGNLQVGEVYCVEPILTNGKDPYGLLVDPDGWVYVTSDGKPCAMFEHMVEITPTGPKILTTHISKEQIV